MSSHIIGGLNERSLHLQLKNHYAGKNAVTEEKIDNYVIDIVTSDELIEIQTGSFSGIRKKLADLLPCHRIRIVHPVAAETIINVYNEDGSPRSRRRSPKRGSYFSAAAELLYIAELLPEPNLSVEIVLVRQEEIRRDDGKGARRRRGVSIEDRLLSEIIESRVFSDTEDYLRLLPPGLESPFGNREIAERLPPVGAGSRGRLRLAGQITWLLRKLELIETAGKDGRRLLFR